MRFAQLPNNGGRSSFCGRGLLASASLAKSMIGQKRKKLGAHARYANNIPHPPCEEENRKEVMAGTAAIQRARKKL